jgi:uncharacterized integral membrane protein
MADSAASHPTTSTPSAAGTLPPPSANGTAPPRPASPGPVPRRPPAKISGSPARLIGAAIACVIAIIFAIQNIHSANISFLGVHLLLPLAVALLLAAVAGSLLTIAAGPARTARLRKLLRHGQTRPDAR